MIVSIVCLFLINSSMLPGGPQTDDSLNVRFVGQCDTPGSAYHVVVQGSYAYVADYAGGLRVINVSAPNAPFEEGCCDSCASAMHVSVLGSHAYVGGRYQSMDVINVQNPAAPYVEGVYTIPTSSGIFNIDVVYPRAYCISSFYCPSPQSLRALDISTPSNPFMLDSCLAGEGTGMHQGLCIDGDYAYVISYANPKFLVIDISNIDSMYEVASCNLPYWFAYDIQQQDTLVYCAALYDGVVLVNVADPTNPQVVGQHVVPGQAMGICLDNDLAYVAARDCGLRVLDISDPAQIVEVGFHDTPSYAYDVFYQTPYIYVADINGGLVIYEYLATGTNEASERLPIRLFRLLQNPVEGNHISLQFSSEATGEYRCRLYDATGRLCRDYGAVASGSRRLQLPVNEPQGVYFLGCSRDYRVVQIEKVVIP